MDDDPRAVYFRQARFGMFGRMALLLTLSSCRSSVPVIMKSVQIPVSAAPTTSALREASCMYRCTARSVTAVRTVMPRWRCSCNKNKESVAEQVCKERRDEKSHKAFRPCVLFRKWWFDLVSHLIIKQKTSKQSLSGKLTRLFLRTILQRALLFTYRCFRLFYRHTLTIRPDFRQRIPLPQLRACFHSRCGCRSWSYPHSSDQECFAVCGYPRRSGT